MNSEFAELSHARYRSRTRRRRILILVGVLLILAGYALMAVSPETSTDWALARRSHLSCVPMPVPPQTVLCCWWRTTRP